MLVVEIAGYRVEEVCLLVGEVHCGSQTEYLSRIVLG